MYTTYRDEMDEIYRPKKTEIDSSCTLKTKQVSLEPFKVAETLHGAS